jgi:ferredoxin
MKMCNTCEDLKELEDFRINRNKCRECERIESSQYKRNHKKEIGIYNRQYDLDLKIETLNTYGGCRCSLCPEDNLRCLSIDHINGGGNEQRKSTTGGRGGSPFYCWLKRNNFPDRDKLRVLCMNCNIKSKNIIISTYAQTYYHNLKFDILTSYGGCKCTLCGIEDLDILTLDHINGGGNKHRKEIGKSGCGFYVWLRYNSFPDKDLMRTLCYNCQAKESYRLNYSI